MKIVIVGQGAIGLLYYALLAQQETHKITLLPSSRSPKLPSSFTYINSHKAKQNIALVQANVEDIFKCDLILFCVKSYQVKSALHPLLAHINPNTPIIFCHNGMGVYDELPSSFIHTNPVLTLLSTHGSKKHADFEIEHTGTGYSDIGVLNKQLHEFSSQHFLTQIAEGLGDVFWHEDIIKFQWFKLAVNCVINPITALNNIENGQVLSPKYQKVMTHILSEVIAVAANEGYKLNKSELTHLVLKVAQKTTKNSSSMRCDVLAKRQTEIDYINGYVHRLGLKHNIPTPENTQLWKAISGA